MHDAGDQSFGKCFAFTSCPLDWFSCDPANIGGDDD
jgi:hypothetical protein